MEERRHLFVASTVTVFGILQASLELGDQYRAWPDETAALKDLLSCMIGALEASRESKIRDCGASIVLPWPAIFARMLTTAGGRTPLVHEHGLRQHFKNLLVPLRVTLHEGLLSGDSVAGDLENIVSLPGRSPESLAGWIVGHPISYRYE